MKVNEEQRKNNNKKCITLTKVDITLPIIIIVYIESRR